MKHVFIGYEGEGPNYKLYNLTSEKITISKNVKFNEGKSTAISGDKKQEWPVIIKDDAEKKDSEEEKEPETTENFEPSGVILPADQKPSLRDRTSLRTPERFQACFAKAEEHMALCCELEEPVTYKDVRKCCKRLAGCFEGRIKRISYKQYLASM